MTHQALDRHRIRWVAFDAVGTLIHPEPAVPDVYHRIAVRHGSRLEQGEIAIRFHNVFEQLEREAILPCGCPEADDPLHACETRETLRWRTIVERVLDDVVPCEDCFRELFAHFGQPSAWRCFPDVESTLVALQSAGYHLAVASNFDSRLHAVMNGLPALRPIERRIVSSEAGHRKPSARFYQSLLQATGCEPSEILYVGDDPRNDVAAAEAVGIPALLMKKNEKGDKSNY